jgi:hypothetical protein
MCTTRTIGTYSTIILISCTSCELKWRDHSLIRATTTRNVGGTIRVLETWDASRAEERARILGTLLCFEVPERVCICRCKVVESDKQWLT